MKPNLMIGKTDSKTNVVVCENSPLILHQQTIPYTFPVARIWERLRGAYAENTIRAYQTDFEIFSNWCDRVNFCSLPTTPDKVTAFIDYEMESLSSATIRRRVNSISRAHSLSDLPDPTKSETVRLAIRRMNRTKGTRQKQAMGLTSDLRDQLIASTTDDLIGKRDRVVVSLAYDTLRRRSELVSLLIEDIEPISQGGAIILVRKSKTDQEASGKLAYISPASLEYCNDWIRRANISDGFILRSLTRGGNVRKSLYPGTVGRIFKKLAVRAGMAQDAVESISGHSARVGAAQDMAAAGIDIIAIMQAGGWKSHNTVARYVENLDILRGGSFRLANLHLRR